MTQLEAQELGQIRSVLFWIKNQISMSHLTHDGDLAGLFRKKKLAEGRKNVGVLNQLKRSKNRFSAPLAPRKCWDFGG